MRGRLWLAAVRPQGKPAGTWALPKGLIDEGESPAETALREGFEETGVRSRLAGKLGDVRYVYTWKGERVFKVVSFYLAHAVGGRIGELPPGWSARSLRRAGSRSRTRRGFSPTAASAAWPSALWKNCATSFYSFRAAVPTFALNFYNPAVGDQLRSSRKTATIRLGDKSAKYKKGMIVTVLCGARYGQRERVFDAVIDKVEVKQLRELSPREIEHDNPELRRADELAHFLGQLYNREVSEDDIVTIIRFSQITGSLIAARRG